MHEFNLVLDDEARSSVLLLSLDLPRQQNCREYDDVDDSPYFARICCIRHKQFGEVAVTKTLTTESRGSADEAPSNASSGSSPARDELENSSSDSAVLLRDQS